MDYLDEISNEQKTLMDTLEKYAITMIEKETQPLQDLVSIVDQAVGIKLVSGSVVSTVDLTAFELECLRLQAQLNKYSTQNTFRDMKLEAEVTVALTKLTGMKGAAEERKRKAELTVLDERVQNTVNKLIIKGIQGCIDRADKVYEGIKKVMDYRSKEGWFDRKGPQ